jgi:hypothetical protein
MFPHLQRKILLTALLGSLWALSLGFGLRSLFHYESTAGSVGRSPQSWPRQSRIVPSSNQYTLVMLAHPYCPCTKASLNELAQILAQTGGKVRAYVLFLKPENSGSDWDDTSLRRTATGIPGVTVVTDFGGSEAGRFGAETSGHTLLFDPAGQRLFSGGITASRGHAGGNAGENAIVALVNGIHSDRESSLVFGCALTSEKDATN